MTTGVGRPLSVRLPDELRARVAEMAKVTRRSQGDVVREVLERDRGRLEWELRIAGRARRHRSGESAALDAGEVDRLLGLAGVAPDPDALTSVS